LVTRRLDLRRKCLPLAVVLAGDPAGGRIAPDADAQGGEQQGGGYDPRDQLQTWWYRRQRIEVPGASQGESFERHLYRALTDSAADSFSGLLNSGLLNPACLEHIET
jgi:hypothetical protein